VVCKGVRIEDARCLASVPRRRLRRPERGARMSSAASARLRISRLGLGVDVSGDVCCGCDVGASGGCERAGVSLGVRVPWYESAALLGTADEG